MKIHLVLLASLASVASGAAGAFNKCVDPDGNVTYTDRTCAGYGAPVAMRTDQRGVMSYSSGDIIAVSNKATAEIQSQRAARDAAEAAQLAAQAREVAEIRAKSSTYAAAVAKVNVTPLPPLTANTSTYRVIPRR